MDTSEYLGLFLDESRESLQALNASLLDLERDPGDSEPLAVIFRVAHSLKGMSATMGFGAMARLTHRMEEVLAAMRDGAAPVTPAVTDALFACLDTLQDMVDRLAGGDPQEIDASPVMERLDRISHGGAEPALAAAQAAATAAPPSVGERAVVAGAPARGLSVLRVDVTLDEGCGLAGARALMVARELEAHGDLVASEPPARDIEAGEVGGGFAFWIAVPAGTDPDGVRASAMGVGEVAACEVEPADGAVGERAEPASAGAAPPATPTGRAGRSGPRPGRGAATVRVGTDRLDALMDLMGEMVIQRTRLARLASEHGLSDLHAAVEDMRRVTDALQTLVMRVRMMPVDAVFMRFPRMVRDLAGALGKRVDLVVRGEDTELDRTVIDALGDPLVHMLRNAVDHGLESPEDRVAAGKDPTGTVSLCARHAGGSVVIEVRDDGRGMDPGALRAAVVRKRLMDAGPAAALSDEEALQLAFLPGLSTTEQTTDVSGRGVGLDAVRTAIADLGGEVSIRSTIGEGSCFTIRLPLTLAIVQALLVEAGRDRSGGCSRVWAVPLEAIEETVLVDPADTRTLGGRPCVVLRDGVVPLVRLGERPGLGGPRDIGGPDGPMRVVVVRAGSTRVGVVVDGLVGTQDVVVKRLPDILGDVAGVAGATILGDGSVALILDVAALAAAPAPVGTGA